MLRSNPCCCLSVAFGCHLPHITPTSTYNIPLETTTTSGLSTGLFQQRTLQPRLDLVGWRSSPPPLLTKAVSVPWLLRAYATSIERKLSGLFRNILDTNKVYLLMPWFR